MSEDKSHRLNAVKPGCAQLWHNFLSQGIVLLSSQMDCVDFQNKSLMENPTQAAFK